MNIIQHITDKMPIIEQIVVEHSGNHYLISNNKSIAETLAFKCKPDGEVAGWSEVAGGYGRTIAEVMVDIEQGNVWEY
tara:strand:+ start:728 stop:961 length:234 start_codon:yes stop_codon:yes gene_type:complete